MPRIGTIKPDDTPVNGELEKGISSNWAYDEDVTLRALIEAALPWTIFIDVFMTPKSNVNWDSFDLYTGYVHAAGKESSGAQNDKITWDIVLAAGTWTFELMYNKNSDRGIYSVQLDSVEKGTIDGYAEAGVYNVRTSITGIVVATTAKIALKLKMATKNDSATAYYGNITSIKLIRTA